MIRKPFAIAALAAAASFSAHATLNFDDTVTNAVITGSGIANFDFTTDTRNNIELGLRGRERFDLVNNLPTNETGTDFGGNYSQNAGAVAGWARWNFDWSININADGAPQNDRALDSLIYRLGMDFDPGNGTNFVSFDPINVGPTIIPDHSFGDNTTAQGAGVEATTPAEYATLIGRGQNDDSKTLVQNSWNYIFFPGLFAFDPTVDGVYTIFLEASTRSGATPSTLLARTQIDVIVGAGAVTNPPNGVPEPGSLALVGLALAGLAVARKRKSS